ncbi:MAG: plastocyanin/azurin family copper-binding protein [Colwellia sp.]
MPTLKLFTLCLLLCTGIATAKDHTVKLLTQGSNGKMMVFEPIFIKISVGDTVNFVPSDSSHNAESFSVPSEKSSFKTPYGKATKITFNEEGVVLVKCLPHYALGMIGVIQIGDNIDSTKVTADWNKAKVAVAMNKEAVDEALKKIK